MLPRMTTPQTQTEPRRRGRPPKADAADNIQRQAAFVRRKRREAAAVALALKEALSGPEAREAFQEAHRGTPEGDLIRRGLTSALVEEPAAMAFFDGLLSV
jgi:hypothetical protein